MEEVFSLVLCLCLLVATSGASGDKPRLVFNSEGEFKLSVFADCELRMIEKS